LKFIIASNPIKILHRIRKIRPLVVHTWYSNIYQFFIALFAKLFAHSKVILHVTDFEEFFIFSNVKSLKGLVKAILKIFVIKSFPIISDGITMISPNLKTYILKTKTKKKPTYVLLPYTPKNCFKISSRYMKKIKKEKKDFWFLFFGFISKFQGIEEIVKSFLEADIAKAKLIIIGEGPLKNELVNRHKHNKNLVFVKNLMRDKLFCFCKLSDCILCYFPHETINELRLPAKLRESMFFGKPIITTKVGFSKLLSNVSILKVGFDEQDLTKAMKQIYYSKNLRKRLSKNTKKEFKKWFQNEDNVFRLLRFYKKIVG
jgi:glycosyltransferase involved in cell wall biosynthesis